MGRGSDGHNPYTPDMGAPPPYLAGRHRELKHFDDLLQQLSAGGTEKHLILTGLRGVGKTVLLNEFRDRCERAQWVGAVQELRRDSRIEQVIARAARRALLKFSSKERAKEALMRALATLKSFSLTFGDELSLGFDVSAALGSADSGDLVEDTCDLLVDVGRAAEGAGSGFALILDEMQHLPADGLEALIVALHRAKQRKLPVALVGAGLPLLPALTGGAKSYAERGFVFRSIGALSREDADAALAKPSEKQMVSWAPEALTLVFEQTGGYPYFLQEYGREIWQLGDGNEITRPQVERALPVVRDFLDENFFSQRIGKLPESELVYLGALAALGDGPQASSAVAKRMKRAPEAVTALRARLIAAALIYAPRRGYVDFTVPLCAEYLRRRQHMRDSLQEPGDP